MRWLSKIWPIGDQALPRRRISVESFGGPVVSVPQLELMGQHSTSPNARYRLVWQDRGWNGDSADPRGRYVLIDGDVLLVDGRMDRPQDGKVADNGTFVLNDWGLSSELAGKFSVFSADGSLIVTRSYTANLLNNGLSKDGRWAACQTCNSPGSPDSSILTLFNLTLGVVRAAWLPECGWANFYEFSDDGSCIRFLRHDRPSLRFSLDGDFIDRSLWLQDEVRRGTLYVIRKALAEGEAMSGVSHSELRNGVRRCLDEGDVRCTADAWRLLGEIEEAAGDRAAALRAYDLALDANPKVGVAKRAAALRKSLA